MTSLLTPDSPVETAPATASRKRPPAVERFRPQARRRLARADLLGAVGWLSGVAAVALWLADGGASGFSSFAGTMTALGIVAGLIGMDLVLLMLLLAARIPVVDNAIGHDRALEIHKSLGKPALYLLLAHGLFLAIGYGAAEGLDPLSESISLWVNVPDMWLAFVSMALFIAVVVTSLVAVRRKFPYEFWYVVHLLTYAAVGTAIPHQFSVGGLFAEGTWQRWYWLALCIGTGVALAWFRIYQPLAASFRHQLTVSRVVRVAPGVFSIEMTGRNLERLAGSGGRFFLWRFLAPGQWWRPHPFSLSAEPVPGGRNRPGKLRITVRNLGEGSASLAHIRPGTKVAIEGPYGLFSTAARSREDVVMIGAGIGITPLRSLLETTPFDPGHAIVLLRGHDESELFLGQEIMALCQARGVTLYHLTGPRSSGDHSWLPRNAVNDGFTLSSYAPAIANADVYVCGPALWASSVIRDVQAAGVPAEQLHNERFDW
ncbi:ferredoxin reductase family protein [Arthrobacter sp. AK01]|uniref:ferredoxin reductase family protein n=1 Tax=Micrococcaceae TaxID=1268 RepID=UPI001E3C302D|nr:MULTISPECIES: ferredoxin reductase family protein [Micrococcaceae]MCD4852665.1 ferredoxin reductase family protein [Arthrobacter sp. AK01]MCP1411135.1 putative ferric reductase [Paenarthrobacter sp. A20]